MLKRLLIIEDDPDILDILSLIFNEEGYEVILSENDEASHRLPEIRPDMLLLDVRLKGSGENGNAICTRVKAQQATKDLPVMLLSAEPNLALLSRACGADDWISKPFDVISLTAKVRALIERVN